MPDIYVLTEVIAPNDRTVIGVYSSRASAISALNTYRRGQRGGSALECTDELYCLSTPEQL
jgi:hypothetical protein